MQNFKPKRMNLNFETFNKNNKEKQISTDQPLSNNNNNNNIKKKKHNTPQNSSDSDISQAEIKSKDVTAINQVDIPTNFNTEVRILNTLNNAALENHHSDSFQSNHFQAKEAYPSYPLNNISSIQNHSEIGFQDDADEVDDGEDQVDFHNLNQFKTSSSGELKANQQDFNNNNQIVKKIDENNLSGRSSDANELHFAESLRESEINSNQRPLVRQNVKKQNLHDYQQEESSINSRQDRNSEIKSTKIRNNFVDNNNQISASETQEEGNTGNDVWQKINNIESILQSHSESLNQILQILNGNVSTTIHTNSNINMRATEVNNKQETPQHKNEDQTTQSSIQRMSDNDIDEPIVVKKKSIEKINEKKKNNYANTELNKKEILDLNAKNINSINIKNQNNKPGKTIEIEKSLINKMKIEEPKEVPVFVHKYPKTNNYDHSLTVATFDQYKTLNLNSIKHNFTKYFNSIKNISNQFIVKQNDAVFMGQPCINGKNTQKIFKITDSKVIKLNSSETFKCLLKPSTRSDYSWTQTQQNHDKKPNKQIYLCNGKDSLNNQIRDVWRINLQHLQDEIQDENTFQKSYFSLALESCSFIEEFLDHRPALVFSGGLDQINSKYSTELVCILFNMFSSEDSDNHLRRQLNQAHPRCHHIFTSISDQYLFAFGKYSFKTLNDINLISKKNFDCFSILNNELIVSEQSLKWVNEDDRIIIQGGLNGILLELATKREVYQNQKIAKRDSSYHNIFQNLKYDHKQAENGGGMIANGTQIFMLTGWQDRGSGCELIDTVDQQ